MTGRGRSVAYLTEGRKVEVCVRVRACAHVMNSTLIGTRGKNTKKCLAAWKSVFTV